jgi:phage tail sheath protein FI
VVNDGSALIEVNVVALNATAAPNNRPAVTAASVAIGLGLDDGDFLGDEAAKNGLHAFDAVDDINILAIPDRPGDRETIIGAYTYCQNRKDCFFVADPLLGLTPQQVLDFKQGTGDFAGNGFNSSYAALYYPWIITTDPLTGGNKLVPPSGAVVGTYSATDVTRGVHKAPAGIIDGNLNAASGIERQTTQGEQELLNPAQINVIRAFPSGITVWGARTLSADPQWRYINVRRLLLFIEESIENGTQSVVFEPNTRELWARVRRDVTAFLTIVWQSGALFGSTPEEAFFVQVNDENNPPEVRALGRLVIDVGVAPVKPAEFVIFRIAQIVNATT